MNLNTLLSRQFLIFILGGFISAVVDVCVMLWLISLNISPFIAATVGFSCGLLFNYSYHAIFTFKSNSSSIILMRFMMVVAVNYLVTLIFVYISYSFLDIGSLPGKLLSLPIVAINGYLLSKHWVFK
ncbi:MAG: GtrA family protein [Burkholderiaceae bacterium]